MASSYVGLKGRLNLAAPAAEDPDTFPHFGNGSSLRCGRLPNARADRGPKRPRRCALLVRQFSSSLVGKTTISQEWLGVVLEFFACIASFSCCGTIPLLKLLGGTLDELLRHHKWSEILQSSSSRRNFSRQESIYPYYMRFRSPISLSSSPPFGFFYIRPGPCTVFDGRYTFLNQPDFGVSFVCFSRIAVAMVLRVLKRI